MSAKYYYFKPSGKFYTEGEGESIPEGINPRTHRAVASLNDGKMPGLIGDGQEFTVVIIDDESFPRMIPAVVPYGV